MAFRLSTAANLLHRPHLITAEAAQYWAVRLREMDTRAFRRPGRFDALTRKLGLGDQRPLAWDDYDDRESSPPPTRPNAYAPMWMGEPDAQLDWGWSIKDGVAMMEIAGPLVERGGWGWCDFMHGYDTIMAAISEADADERVKGMLIRFDTPGGVVASGIYDLSEFLQARKAKGGAKPLWAICEMACSAGYWIASPFDRVLGTQAGLIGSIGVVMAHENHAAALEKFGVEITTIEAPEGGFKTEGAWWKALSEAGRAALQSDINELFAAFTATVAAGRGSKLTAEKAAALGAQVFPATHSDKARDATALGLIDGVMSEQAAFEALRSEVSASPTLNIPASAGATAAPAASKPANPGATMETSMKRDQRIAAVMAGKTSAKTAEEKLDAINKILNEADGDAEAEGEEEDTGEGEDGGEGGNPPEDDTAARARGAKPAATSAAARPDAATVLAILDLPEASGREKQARKLAETPGMTVEMAKGILAAGPKPSRLAEKVTDPALSGSGADTRSDAKKESDAALRAAGIKVA